MSSSPDQLPTSSESNIPVPHGHEPVSPDASRIEPGIQAPDNVHDGFISRPPSIPERQDWEQKRTEVRNNSTSTPEKKNKKGLKIALAAGTASVAAALGAWGFSVGASGNGFIQQPGTRPTAEAPVTPGPVQTDPSTSVETPVPTNSQLEVPVEKRIFANGDGTYSTQEQLIAQDKVSIEKNPETLNALGQIFESIEDSMNDFPDEKSVRNNLNIPSGQLTQENYLQVAKQRQAITLDTLVIGKGRLRTTLEAIGAQTTFNQFATLNASEPTPYHIDLKYDRIANTLTISDNSTENSIDDNANRDLGVYDVEFVNTEDIVALAEKNGSTWKVSSNVGLLKKPAVK
jgi:hypothetical protein